MKKILSDIWGSFNNKEEGVSARKLTAFWIIVIHTIGNVRYIYHSTHEQFLNLFIEWCIVNLCAIAFFLGLVTFDQIIKFRTGKPEAEKAQQ